MNGRALLFKLIVLATLLRVSASLLIPPILSLHSTPSSSVSPLLSLSAQRWPPPSAPPTSWLSARVEISSGRHRPQTCNRYSSPRTRLSSLPSFCLSALQLSKLVLQNSSCETHPASHSHPPWSRHHNQIHFNAGTNRSQSLVAAEARRWGWQQDGEGEEEGNEMSDCRVKVRDLPWALLNKPSSL